MDHYEELKRLHTETERFYLILKEKEEIVDLLLQLHDQVDQYVQALGFQLPDYLKVPPEIYEAVKEATPPPKPFTYNAGAVAPQQEPEPEPEPAVQPAQPASQPAEEPQPPAPSSPSSHYQKIPNMAQRPTQRAASVSVVPSKPAASPSPPAQQQSQYMAIPVTKSKSFTIVEAATDDAPPPPPEPELPVIPPEADPKWYFGSINRSEAEALLQQCGKNALLVRNSSVPGCFALSIYFQSTKKIAHILIQMNTSGGKIMWSLENSIDANVYENFVEILLQSPECHNHVFAGLLVPNTHWSPETGSEENQSQPDQSENESEVTDQQSNESGESQPQQPAQEETAEEKMLRFRKRVIEEIIQTEKDYTNDLGVLVKHYSSVLSKKESKVISQDDVQKLFSNLSEILDINYSVLNTLEQRKRKGSSGGQYIVGDAFLKIAEDFKPYTVYCINHPVALKTLEKLRASNPGFVQFEKKSSVIPETKGIGLVGFLIKPVQRICKYPILLKELLKYTPPTHVEYENLQAALDKIEQVVDYINERKRIAENTDKLTNIQNMIEGLENFTLPKPTRELIMELPVKKVMKKNALSDYMLWVFNDLFLFAKLIKKDKYKYKGRVHLDALRVIDVIDSEEVKNAFEIEDRNHLDDEKLLMCCNSEKDKKFFMNETKKVIKDYYIQHQDQLQAEANARKYLAEFQFKETDINKLKELAAKKPPTPVRLTSNQNLLATLQHQQLEKALQTDGSESQGTEPTPDPKSPFAHLNRQKSSSVSVVPSRTKPPPPAQSSGSAPSSPSNSFIGLNKSPSTESEPQKEAVTLVFNTGGSTGAVPQRATRRAPARPVSVRSPLQPQGSNDDLQALNSSSEDLSKFATSSEDLRALVHSSSTDSINSQPSPSTSTDKLPFVPPPQTAEAAPQEAPQQATPTNSAPSSPATTPKVTGLPVKTARSSPVKRVVSQSGNWQ